MVLVIINPRSKESTFFIVGRNINKIPKIRLPHVHVIPALSRNYRIDLILEIIKSIIMYVYKSVEIPHGMWSGKPKENMLAVINHHGQHKWRLNTMTTGVRNGRGCTIIIFEKEVDDDYYKTHEIEPLPPEYDAEDFV